MKRAILLLSGGIDSTTLLAQLVAEGWRVECLIFDYQQTLKKEVEVAQATAALYGQPCNTVATPLAGLLGGSCTLLGPTDLIVPTGRTLAEIQAGGTPSTYVPFRNGIFLSYAVALGEALGIARIFCGGNGLNSGNYWDDTSFFARQFENAARAGTSPDYKPIIEMPYANIGKGHIVAIGRRLGVDYDRTWSCYKNGAEPCGGCDSCVQRRSAFEEYTVNYSATIEHFNCPVIA